MECKIEDLLPFSKCLKKKAVARFVSIYADEKNIHGIPKDMYEALRKTGIVKPEYESETSVIVKRKEVWYFVPKVCFKRKRR